MDGSTNANVNSSAARSQAFIACCFVPVSRESGEQLILFIAARMAFLQRNREEEFLRLKGIPFRAFHRARWRQHLPAWTQAFPGRSEICGPCLQPLDAGGTRKPSPSRALVLATG